MVTHAAARSLSLAPQHTKERHVLRTPLWTEEGVEASPEPAVASGSELSLGSRKAPQPEATAPGLCCQSSALRPLCHPRPAALANATRCFQKSRAETAEKSRLEAQRDLEVGAAAILADLGHWCPKLPPSLKQRAGPAKQGGEGWAPVPASRFNARLAAGCVAGLDHMEALDTQNSKHQQRGAPKDPQGTSKREGSFLGPGRPNRALRQFGKIACSGSPSCKKQVLRRKSS